MKHPNSVNFHKLNHWFAVHGRDLPWRRLGTSAWAILLSEIMSQQTPVARVIPFWHEWLQRWPTPTDLAAAPTREVITAWGNLGYPRRALRLQETAAACVARHRGELPRSITELEALPGVGSYTARAVAAFAFDQAVPVVDTNVRRVHYRLIRGEFLPGPARASDLAAVADMMPWVDADPALEKRGYHNPHHDVRQRPEALLLTSSLMELGALVCTARSPQCTACPVREDCQWVRLGSPEPTDEQRAAAARRVQKFAGTDRQARGVVLRALRTNDSGTASREHIDTLWPDAVQLERAVNSLAQDGLIRITTGGLALPD